MKQQTKLCSCQQQHAATACQEAYLREFANDGTRCKGPESDGDIGGLGNAAGEKGGGFLAGEGRSSAVLCLPRDACVGARYCAGCTAVKHPIKKDQAFRHCQLETDLAVELYDNGTDTSLGPWHRHGTSCIHACLWHL